MIWRILLLPTTSQITLNKQPLDNLYFLRENTFGIIIDDVPHAVGDYWMFEADYTDLWEYLSPDFQALLKDNIIEPLKITSPDVK